MSGMYREEQTKYLQSAVVMKLMDEIVAGLVQTMPTDPSQFVCDMLMNKTGTRPPPPPPRPPTPPPDKTKEALAYITACFEAAATGLQFPKCPEKLQAEPIVKKIVALEDQFTRKQRELEASTRKETENVKRLMSDSLFECAQLTLRSGMAVEEVLAGVVEAAKCLIHAEDCAVFIADEKNRSLHFTIRGKAFKLRYGQGIAGSVARTGCSLLIPKAYEDPRFDPKVDMELGHVTRDILCLPIVHKSKLVAVVQLVNKIDGTFGRDDELLFAAFADFIGIGLQNALLYQEEQVLALRNRKLAAAIESVANTDLQEEHLIPVIVRDAKQLVGADRCAFFLVHEERGVITAHLEGVRQQMELPIGAGVVGWCAEHKCILNVPDAYVDPRFSRDVDLSSGYRTRNILCIPILVEDQIVAVSQLVNKMDKVGEIIGFTEEDEETLSQFAAVAGVCMRNCRLLRDIELKRALVESAMETSRAVCMADVTKFQDVCDVASRAVVTHTKAERCILFVLSNDYRVFTAPDPDSTGALLEVPFAENFLARAAKTKTPICEENLTGPDAKIMGSNFVLREVAAVPVMIQNDCVGVIAVANKGCGRFNAEDYTAIELFSMFIAVAIRNTKIFAAARQQHDELAAFVNFERAVTEEVMSSDGDGMGAISPSASLAFLAAPSPAPLTPVTMQTTGLEAVLSSDIDAILQTHPDLEQLGLLASPKFNIHLFRDGILESSELLPLALRMFDQLNLVSHFNLRHEPIAKFLYLVRSKYRNVPYHNFFHAFDVAQTMFTFLNKIKASEFLPPVDLLAVLLASFTHDIDHMGLNNSYHLKAETPMGILTSLTGNKSVLEIHHCQLTVELFQHTGLLNDLPAAQKTQVYKTIVDCIMATDMARHKEYCTQFECDLIPALEQINSGEQERSPEKTPPNIRKLVLILLLKMADISNITKEFDTSRKWGISVMEEFYQQGDVERKAGMDVTPMFDREKKVELAKGQKGFISLMGKPFFVLGARCLPTLSYLVEQIDENMRVWDRLLNPPA